jgi:hypothetical protein
MLRNSYIVLFAGLLARSQWTSGRFWDQPCWHRFPWPSSVFKQMLRYRILGSHTGGYNSSIFWYIKLVSLLKLNRRIGGICCFHFQGRIISQKPAFLKQITELLATCFTLISCLAYSLTLKKEAICVSETLLDFQWTTRRYIPEHRTL